MVRIVALAVTGKRLDILYTGGVLTDAFSLLAESGMLDDIPADASLLLNMTLVHITEDDARAVEEQAAKLAGKAKEGGQ